MRCAITIIYNGLHHLTHGDFVTRMLEMFDYWIIVDGHSKPGGSTAWCNDLKHVSPISTDGTREYLTELANGNARVRVILNQGYWKSKDEQFQAGVNELKTITNECTLWQVDVDEWWDLQDIEYSEAELVFDCGAVRFDHVIGGGEGRILLAQGKWGSGFVNRVWKWKGQDFTSHEPPTMQHQGIPQQLTRKFLHFSYYFEKDVQFKSRYYKGYGDFYKNWKDLQRLKNHQFPIHAYRIFGRRSRIGNTNTRIISKLWRQEAGVLLRAENH